MKNILHFFLFMLPVILSSQQNIEFTKDNFPNKKSELKTALKNLEKGNSYYLADEYIKYLSLDFYLKAYSFNPNNIVLNYRIGNAFLHAANKTRALEYLKKAYEMNPEIDSAITFYLGEASHLNHDFDNAISFYNLYKSSPKRHPRFDPDKRIQECNDGKNLVANPVRVIIENLGPTVNSKYPEYATVLTADESVMYFTSRRNTTSGKLIADDGMYFEDILSSTKQNNAWTAPINVPAPVNTKLHDATVALSSDGQKLFIYTDENEGDILQTKLNGDEWSNPESAGGNAINSRFSEIHACYSFDERSIYFVSDNPEDNLGGFDIYVTRVNEKGLWGKPENLGPTINTKYDEEGVYMHPDGKTMYFSSKGHNTMGSYDIFRSTLVDGKWSEAENVGYPINSADRDAFFVVSASGKHGYYSSARMDAIGETDIYIINILGPEKEPVLNVEDQLLLSRNIKTEIQSFGEARAETVIASINNKDKFRSEVTILKGKIFDANDLAPLNATIVITDNEKNTTVSTFKANSKTGQFLVSLPSGKNYGIAVTMDDYLFHSENINLPKSTAYQEISKDIALEKLEIGKKIVLRNIFYDFNKSSLRPASISELDRLTLLLEQNPTMRIEISSHTDNIGSAVYNAKLSLNRAVSVVDYLLDKKGINKDRLEFKGYGFEQPIAPNDSDQGRQLNRRTEFKILSK